MIQFLLLFQILLRVEGTCNFESFEEAQLDSHSFYGEKSLTLDQMYYAFGFWYMYAPMRKNYYLSYQKPFFDESQPIDGVHFFNFQIDGQIQTLVYQMYTIKGQTTSCVFLMQTYQGLQSYEFYFDYSKYEGYWVFLYCTYYYQTYFEFITYNTGDGRFDTAIQNYHFSKDSSEAKLQYGGRGLFHFGGQRLNLDLFIGRLSKPIILFEGVNFFYPWQINDFLWLLSNQNCFMPQSCPEEQQISIFDSVFTPSNLSINIYSFDVLGDIDSIQFWLKRPQQMEQNVMEYIFAFGTNIKGRQYNRIEMTGHPFKDLFYFRGSNDGYYIFPNNRLSLQTIYSIDLIQLTSWCYFKYIFIKTIRKDIVKVQVILPDGSLIIWTILDIQYFHLFTNFQGVLTLFSGQVTLIPKVYKPFSGAIANLRISYCSLEANPIPQDADLNCHELCKTCFGPNRWDCLTCYSEQNRLYLEKKHTCICFKNYQEIDGQLVCQEKIQSIPIISKTKQINQIQCNYGEFSVYNDDGSAICIKCPYLHLEKIQCLNCLLNSDKWQQNAICDLEYQFLNEKIYSLIQRDDYELFKIIRDTQTAEICQGCKTLTTCFQNSFYLDGNCIPCGLNCAICENKSCVECGGGYYLKNEECQLCPENCINCEYDMGLKCTACPKQYTIVNGECKQCGDNCQQCEIRTFNDQNYLKCLVCQPDSFISLDGVSCFWNTIELCIVPFQFSNQNLEINTIFYDFPPQQIQYIQTGCTFCQSYASLIIDNNEFSCYPLKLDNIIKQCSFMTYYHGTGECQISPEINDYFGYCYHQYPNCQFCPNLYDSIIKYCILCEKGYYNDYYTSFCIPCPEVCLGCYESDSSKIKKFVQLKAINLVFNLTYNQFIEQSQDPDSHNIQIYCTECQVGYNLYDNKCRIDCPSNCKECEYIDNLPLCLSCLDLDEYSRLTLQNGECIPCPTNCKLCKTRTAQEKAQINAYFSNKELALFSNQCVVPLDPSLYYDQELKQFINCEECEKYIDIEIAVVCDSSVPTDMFNIYIDKLFNSNFQNYLFDIETSEYFLYLNTEYVKYINYKFFLEQDSVCTLNENSYFISKLQQNVFNILKINFQLEGNNSTFLLNGNITLSNFSSITIQNLNIQNGSIVTDNLKDYSIRLENIIITGNPESTSQQSSFQFNQANSIILQNIGIINMNIQQTSLIVISSPNYILNLELNNFNIQMSQFNQTFFISLQAKQSYITFKKLQIYQTIIYDSKFISGFSQLELIKFSISNSQIIDSDSFFLLKNMTKFDSFMFSSSIIQNSTFIQAETGLNLINSHFLNLQIYGNSTILSFSQLAQDCTITVLDTDFIDLQYQEKQPIMLVTNAGNFKIVIIFNGINLININLQRELMQYNYQASIKQSLFYLDCSQMFFENVNIIKGLGFSEFSILNVLNFTFSNSNVILNDEYQFRSINPISNCTPVSINTFYLRTFMYFNNVLETNLKNVTFQNLILYDSAFIDYKQTIQLNNSLFTMSGCYFAFNVIHQTETDARVSLLKIESFAVLSVQFYNNQFNNNLLSITISETSTQEGLLFTVISNICTISGNIFSQNMIINGQSSIFQIDSKELIIENSTFLSNSIFVYETLKQFLFWGFESVVYQEDLEQLFPVKSFGGNGNLKASKISITNSQVEKSHSKFGGAFAITLLENGYLYVQNSSFQYLSVDMSDNSQGGCFFITSNAEILSIVIIKSTFQFIEARESGGFLQLQILSIAPSLVFVDSIFSNIFALQGSLVSSGGHPSLSIKKCQIKNEEQNLQKFLNNIYQLSNLELTILIQYFSLVDFTDGLIEIENLTITEHPPLQFLYTKSSVYMKDIKFINVLFARPLLTFTTNANKMIIKIDSFTLINCTLVKELKVNQIEVLQSRNIKPTCIRNELPPQINLAGYSSRNLNYQIFAQLLLDSEIQGVIFFDGFKDSDIITIKSLSIQVSCKTCQYGVLGLLNQKQTNTKITGLIISNSKCGNQGCLHINADENRLLNEEYTRRNSIQIRNLICSGNQAKLGGCLYLKNQKISIYESYMQNNSATLGGAIYIEGSQSILDANQLSLYSNNATVGSGIYSTDNYLSQQEGILFFNNIGQTIAKKPSQLQIQFFPDQIITPIVTFRDQYHVKSQIISRDGIETTIYLPTGIEIQKYRRFSMKSNLYISDYQILRLYPVTESQENIEQNGTYCNCWVIDDNDVKYPNLTNKNAFYFNKEFYDFGDLILYIPQDTKKKFWLQFWCNSLFTPVIVNGLVIDFHQNYTLKVRIKPYECQLGEYHSGEQDYCHQCQTDKKQYSITQNSTQCSTQNDSIIVDITSAQVKLNTGYWRYLLTSSTIDNCQNKEENCIGGWSVGNTLCLKGYIGALCEQCDAYDIRGHGSYYESQQFQCQPCENTYFANGVQAIASTIIFIIFLIFFYVLYIEGQNMTRYLKLTRVQQVQLKESISLQYIKLTLQYFQIVSLLAELYLNYGNNLQIIIDVFGNPFQMNFLNFCFFNGYNFEIVYFDIIQNTLILIAILIFQLIILMILKQVKPNKERIFDFAYLTYLFYGSSILRCVLKLISFRKIQDFLWIYQNVAYIYNTSIHLKVVFGVLIPIILFYVFYSIYKILNERKLNQLKIIKYGIWYQAFKDCQQEQIKIITLILIHVCIIFIDGDYSQRCLIAFFVLTVYYQRTNYSLPYCSDQQNLFELRLILLSLSLMVLNIFQRVVTTAVISDIIITFSYFLLSSSFLMIILRFHQSQVIPTRKMMKLLTRYLLKRFPNLSNNQIFYKYSEKAQKTNTRRLARLRNYLLNAGKEQLKFKSNIR